MCIRDRNNDTKTTPQTIPASHNDRLKIYEISKNLDAICHARIDAPDAANIPAESPMAENSDNKLIITFLFFIPTARKRALSNFLSSMVECTAEKRTVIPAIKVKIKTACTAMLTFVMTCLTCCKIGSRSTTETVG